MVTPVLISTRPTTKPTTASKNTVRICHLSASQLLNGPTTITLARLTANKKADRVRTAASEMPAPSNSKPMVTIKMPSAKAVAKMSPSNQVGFAKRPLITGLVAAVSSGSIQVTGNASAVTAPKTRKAVCTSIWVISTGPMNKALIGPNSLIALLRPRCNPCCFVSVAYPRAHKRSAANAIPHAMRETSHSQIGGCNP